MNIVQPSDMGRFVADFVADLRLGGRADETVIKHAAYLRDFDAWLVASGLAWREVSRLDVSAYARLFADRGRSLRANMMSSLRTFYSWAVDQGYVSSSPAKHLKTPSRLEAVPRALNKAQVRLMLAYLASREGLRARRDEMAVLTGLYTGLRARELARLRWVDIDFDALVLRITLSKMRHGRVVPLNAQLAGHLLAWRKLQALGGDVTVFTLDGVPLVSNRITKIAMQVRKATGLPLTAHVLRHTFATWALRGSKDVYAVSKALGHKQLRQTEIYVSVEVEHIRPSVEALPDMGAW